MNITKHPRPILIHHFFEMAAPVGYQCEFVDSVPEDFYCKQCSLVARRLTFTSCCGESYCNGCIHSTQQDNKPCPECGQESFEISQQVKYQRKILSFRVHCSVKERGCGWCGPLEHLDAHLDPDTGDCLYTDINCPLKCQHKINKKNLEHHLAKECVKRDYVCPYCAFKAPYEIVTDIHWPECSYYPLVCPNRCGVTCERPTMEDHLKICRLQQVECQFEQIGCLEKFSREDLEEHMREKAQTHLTMMAATSVKMQQEFQAKLQEQERRLEGRCSAQEEEFQAKLQEQERRLEGRCSAQEEEFQAKLQEQERRLEGRCSAQEEEFQAKQEMHKQELQEQEKNFQGKFQEQEKRFEKQEQNFREMVGKLEKRQDVKIREQKTLLEDFKVGAKTALEELKRRCGVWKVTMENFSKEKAKNKASDWKGPPMYTHPGGYKFCIGIDANGYVTSRGKSVNVEVWVMKGEYDDQLQWPATAKFTLELINHFENGENKTCTITPTWRRPIYAGRIGTFLTVPGISFHFISHSELPHNPVTRTHFLRNDTLNFHLSV